ncbi:MAG: hypothetical protein IH885_10670 [Myxococcales bacterium]|nr:hypothetical protein [Myxococcales bacterium]
MTGATRTASESPHLALARTLPDVSHPLLCAGCHVEHRGRNVELATLSDGQCQVCHSFAFASFGEGHPEFRDYPFDRPTTIRFSHRTHELKHFSTGNRAGFDCLSCHTPSRDTASIGLRGYDASCDECHAEDVSGELLRSGSRGIALLRLPSVDLAAFDDPERHPLGDWPKSRRVKRSPFVDLLVRSDERLSPEDRALLSELNFEKLDEASDDEKDAVARYVWATKRLFAEVGTKGHAAIEARLAHALDAPIDPDLVTDLLGQIGIDAVETANARWLPRLSQELEIADGGRSTEALRLALATLPPTKDDPPKSKLSDRNTEARSERGGWFLQKRGYSVNYRPGGHADPFLRTWLEFSGMQAGSITDIAGPAEAIFALLTRKNAPGRCAMCHSFDADDSGLVTTRWQGSRETFQPAPVSRFDHRPHLVSGAANPCGACHLMSEIDFKTAKAALEVYETRDFAAWTTGDFVSLETDDCASCHSESTAGDSCAGCHDYHRGIPTASR